MKEADEARLAKLVVPRIEQRRGVIAGASLTAVVALLKQRAKTLNELADEAMLFYGPHTPDAALLAEHLSGKSRQAVQAFVERASSIAWERVQISALLKQLLAEQGIKMPQLAVPLRVAVTGRTQTPSIDAVLELLGREVVVGRLQESLARVAH
jgi:glutamyl-tRNA synthetase